MGPNSTATVMAKIAMVLLGLSITLFGIVLSASLFTLDAAGVPLDQVGIPVTIDDAETITTWILLVGFIVLATSVIAWVLAPLIWGRIALWIIGVYLAITILGNLAMSLALAVTGIEARSPVSDGFVWRIILTVASLAIGLLQWQVARILTTRPPERVTRSTAGLRVSAVLVPLFGTIAAWSSPASFVVVLSLAAAIYFAIELLPRST